ncbi:MAG: hypothetical protein HQ549_06780 [Candidatus Omnitrophica bacterium]|nr:hypothetical protein [Candidatus Omnitrophota bacterium]
MKYKFATAINCIDGRTQKPVIDFVRRKFSVDYVDMITEPGPDKILSENKKSGIVKSIKDRVTISIEKHESKVIVIVGHHDCAGNPVNEKTHQTQIKKAIQNVDNWNSGVPVFGIWLNKGWKGTFCSMVLSNIA